MIDISYHAKIRLYVPNELMLTKKIELNKKQSHYLMTVMRRRIHGPFLVFFNFGVWLFSVFYTKDLDGLLQCYILAIPFFTNTIISTFIFGMLFEISIMSKNKIRSLIYK